MHYEGAICGYEGALQVGKELEVSCHHKKGGSYSGQKRVRNLTKGAKNRCTSGVLARTEGCKRLLVDQSGLAWRVQPANFGSFLFLAGQGSGCTSFWPSPYMVLYILIVYIL